MIFRCVFLALLCTLAAAAGAASFSPPPPLDPYQLPVLVYSESEFGKQDVNVYLAHRDDGKWKRETLMSAPFVALEFLEAGKFLLASGPSAQESELYLVDLLAGTSIQITSRKGHCPIAFERPHERFFRWKEAFKAFVIQDADGANDVEFITIDYAKMTYESTSILKSAFGPKYDDQLHIKIGPNGAHLAFMQLHSAPDTTPRTQEFQLKIFHFADKTVSVASPKVTIQVAEKAPTPFGVPPFEWQDWENILWGDIDPEAKGDDANITFFTTDVHKDTTTPLFSQRVPLTATGGELYRESPLVKEILYRPQGTPTGQLEVDLEANELKPFDDPDRLRFQKDNGDVQVGTATRLLLHAQSFAEQAAGIVSPRRLCYAYTVSTGPDKKDKDQKMELYANVEDATGEKVTGPVYYCRSLAWIEMQPAPPVETPVQ